jgi:hypothetical protein
MRRQGPAFWAREDNYASPPRSGRNREVLCPGAGHRAVSPGEASGAISQLRKMFEVDRQGINLPRGLVATAVLLIPFVVLALVGHEKYWLSLSFGALFACEGRTLERTESRPLHG